MHISEGEGAEQHARQRRRPCVQVPIVAILQKLESILLWRFVVAIGCYVEILGCSENCFSAKSAMSTFDLPASSSAPAYQEMVSENPLHNRGSASIEITSIEPVQEPGAHEQALVAELSPPPSQQTPHSSPRRSQTIVEASGGALSILANEISFQPADESHNSNAEEDVFSESDNEKEPKKRHTLKKEDTQTILPDSMESPPTKPRRARSREAPPRSEGKRYSKRVSIAKTTVRCIF